MLADVDVVIFDIQDTGTRYYTFIYTMALAMKACQQQGKSFIVLDRPNPINGSAVEGTVLDPNFSSFVGLYPLAIRHGMTVENWRSISTTSSESIVIWKLSKWETGKERCFSKIQDSPGCFLHPIFPRWMRQSSIPVCACWKAPIFPRGEEQLDPLNSAEHPGSNLLR